MYSMEVCIHPRGGLESPSKPAILAFPEALICSDCGFAELALAETELRELNSIAA
jgi:hypothetical protein